MGHKKNYMVGLYIRFKTVETGKRQTKDGR